jgi:hypothetical protein
MRITKRIVVILSRLSLALFAIAMTRGEARADPIVLISGNGVPGGLDRMIRFKSFGNFEANAPTAGDFLEARTGTPATIRPFGTPDPPFWSPLTGYPTAFPAYNTAGHSTLFAMPFNIADSIVASASLEFEFRVDNYLGGDSPVAQGLYLNGIALSGDTRAFDPSGAPVFFEGTITRSDIAPLLIPDATNWLYVNVTDRVPGAGILFGATLQTAVPEPSTIVPFSIGGILILVECLRRRRRTAAAR